VTLAAADVGQRDNGENILVIRGDTRRARHDELAEVAVGNPTRYRPAGSQPIEQVEERDQRLRSRIR
jgi:hypothetical protein